MQLLYWFVHPFGALNFHKVFKCILFNRFSLWEHVHMLRILNDVQWSCLAIWFYSVLATWGPDFSKLCREKNESSISNGRSVFWYNWEEFVAFQFAKWPASGSSHVDELDRVHNSFKTFKLKKIPIQYAEIIYFPREDMEGPVDFHLPLYTTEGLLKWGRKKK